MKTKEAIERVRSRFSKWALDDEDLTALQTLGLVDVESEDEKIRKEIINYLGLVGKGKGDYAQPMIDRWIAYLEKQKESKAVELDHDREQSLFISAEESLGISQEEYNKIVDECIFGEQKPSEWDDKIRNELWEYFHQLQLESDKDFSPNFTIDDVIEWLENRKYYVKVKTIVRTPKFRIGDIIQCVPHEKQDRTARVCFIDENGYGVDYSHLGDTIKRDYIGFSFEDSYELVKEDKIDRK